MNSTQTSSSFFFLFFSFFWGGGGGGRKTCEQHTSFFEGWVGEVDVGAETCE